MKLHQIADDTGGGHATIAQVIPERRRISFHVQDFSLFFAFSLLIDPAKFIRDSCCIFYVRVLEEFSHPLG